MKDVKGVKLEDIIKDMTEEELERFNKERYEKFIKPLMGLNFRTIKNISDTDKQQ